MKNTNSYPAYMEVEIKNGHVEALNGKFFNEEGVKNVLTYVANDAGVDFAAVQDKIKELSSVDGTLHLKLYNGSVSAC